MGLTTRQARDALSEVLRRYPNTDEIAILLADNDEVALVTVAEYIPPKRTASEKPPKGRKRYALRPIALIDVLPMPANGAVLPNSHAFRGAGVLGIDRYRWAMTSAANIARRIVDNSVSARFADVVPVPGLDEKAEFYSATIRAAKRLGHRRRLFGHGQLYEPLGA